MLYTKSSVKARSANILAEDLFYYNFEVSGLTDKNFAHRGTLPTSQVQENFLSQSTKYESGSTWFIRSYTQDKFRTLGSEV